MTDENNNHVRFSSLAWNEEEEEEHNWLPIRKLESPPPPHGRLSPSLLLAQQQQQQQPMEGGGGDGNSVPLNKNRDTTTTTTSTTSTSTTLTSSTTGSSTTNSTADTTNDRNSIVAISSTNNISIATTEDAVDNTPPGTNNNNSSCRVQFNTTPNVVEIPVYEIPSVHFETNVGAADPLAFSFSSIDNCTTNPPIHLNLAALSLASSDKDVVLPYRKLDSPPPTPKALESISPAPIPSSSANARLLLIPTEEGDEGPEGEDGHVCFAPTLTTVLPPGREEHAVHFCRPSPDDLLDHDGPHRNLESPPPPPEIVNMIKSPSVSGDGNDENEYATKNTTDDSEYNENGEPHVHFSAAPQVVEFFPVESAHVHFSNDNNSNPAEEDADNQNNVDNDHDVSPHPHRKLESPPPPLEDADHRLSPTPSDSSSKKQQSLLLPIVPNDDGIAEEDDRDSTGPRVHFSTSVFVEDTSQNAAQQQVEKDPQPPVLRVVQFAESNLPTSGGDGGTAQNQRFVSPPPPPLVQQPHDAIQINGGSSEIELLLDQVEITQVVESDRVHIAAQVSNYVGPERTNYVGPERMTSTSNSVQAMPSGHAPSDAELGRSYESRSSSLTMSTTNVTEIKKSPDSSSAGRILSSTSSSGNSDGLHLTSSLRSSGETSAGKKFSSKDLRGNLTRRQIDRDPLEIYEITAMLGEGSMGSVAKVRKRPLAVGGSSRKNPEVFETTVVTHITPLVHHPCFNLPFFGSLFRDCFNGTESPLNDSSRHSKEEVALLLDSTETVSSAEIIYAMKSIHLDRCTDLTLIEELKNEVEMLKTLDHPHIVKAIETFEFRNQLFVTMELCSGGDLYSHDPYTEEEAARITMAILSAVSYMHSKGVSHRDLKYENILFVNDNPHAEVKLIDFGLSQMFGKEGLTDGVGTIYTMAPEVVKGKYTKNADLWSIGVIAYMLMSSQMPFYGRNRKEIIQQILRGQYEYKGRRWKRISKQGKAFVDDLLVVDPDDRATTDEAMKASWLNRRFSATARGPHFAEIQSVKNSIVKYADHAKLRRVALMVIAHKSTAAEIGILRKFFQQYDTLAIGHLNFDQFKLAISCVGFTENDYRKIFDAVDIDGSEKIRYTEFLAAAIESMGPISEDRLAEAFDLLDYCDAGYITAESLSSMLGEELPRDDVDDIIREAAPDNNGKVSFQEFLALWEDPDEINEYEIIRGIIIGDSERSANVSGMSSEEETERGTRGSSPMKPVVKRTLSAEGQKRVMFSE